LGGDWLIFFLERFRWSDYGIALILIGKVEMMEILNGISMLKEDFLEVSAFEGEIRFRRIRNFKWFQC
jgi:hypothetical protein